MSTNGLERFLTRYWAWVWFVSWLFLTLLIFTGIQTARHYLAVPKDVPITAKAHTTPEAVVTLNTPKEEK